MEQVHAFAGFWTSSPCCTRSCRTSTSAPRPPSSRPRLPGGGPPRGPRPARPRPEWFDLLDAPAKQLIIFGTAGHRRLFEQPDLFHQVMTETVLPQT